uniref:COX6C domain-containing protein n=1 Tax=Parastrongyloides trichosuri TaxID=131310 RepID=A0A0N4ZKJ1_PARTI
MAPVMRGMIHSFARQGIFLGLGAGFASTIAFYFGFVQPRQKKYDEFFANYDPYTRMREICEAGKGYMHTCPEELAKLYEEKGKPIASNKSSSSTASFEVISGSEE